MNLEPYIKQAEELELNARGAIEWFYELKIKALEKALEDISYGGYQTRMAYHVAKKALDSLNKMPRPSIDQASR